MIILIFNKIDQKLQKVLNTENIFFQLLMKEMFCIYCAKELFQCYFNNKLIVPP